MSKKKSAPATENMDSVPGSITPVGKITVATVVGKIKVSELPVGTDELLLCKIAGYASGIKSGTTQYGDWQALTGEFAATSYITGEIFMGKTAIVPGAMGEALIDTVTQRLSEDASARVAFSVNVSVKRSPRNPDEKYEYIVRPVLDAKISSPAMALLEMNGGAVD